MRKKYNPKHSKLILGTAQFGKPYGINNIGKKRISKSSIKKILSFSHRKKINHLDTAFEYDFNFKLLGTKKQWLVDTKIIIREKQNMPSHFGNKLKRIFKLKNIKLSTIYIHNPQMIFTKNGKKIFQMLNEMKKSKLIKNIGISIYEPSLLTKIIKKFNVDVVQLPYNILDRRFEKYFTYLNKKGINVYVRSVFLQGLLLSKKENKLTKSEELKRFTTFSRETKISKENLCLQFVMSNKSIKKIIFGVDNLKQLKSISKIKKIKKLQSNFLSTKNLNIIDPRRW